jgi:hypothetical protein
MVGLRDRSPGWRSRMHRKENDVDTDMSAEKLYDLGLPQKCTRDFNFCDTQAD